MPVIEPADVRAAAGRLAGIAHRTPVLTSRTLDERAGSHVFLKAECLQRAGASSGITIVARTPRRRAASATACAWLPEE